MPALTTSADSELCAPQQRRGSRCQKRQTSHSNYALRPTANASRAATTGEALRVATRLRGTQRSEWRATVYAKKATRGGEGWCGERGTQAGAVEAVRQQVHHAKGVAMGQRCRRHAVQCVNYIRVEQRAFIVRDRFMKSATYPS